MHSLLTEMLQHHTIWRGDDLAQTERPGFPSGFAALDQALPGGGWPVGALTEILSDAQGIGELSLIAPAIAAQTRQGNGVVLINPPHWLYGPAWAAHGVALAHCLVVRPERANDVLWVAEQSLRAGACGLVVVWPEFKQYAPDYRVLRRLQTAADTGQTTGIVFRSAHVAHEASPAPLRLQLATCATSLAVSIIKRRGTPLPHPILLPMRSEALRAAASTDQPMFASAAPQATPGAPSQAAPPRLRVVSY